MRHRRIWALVAGLVVLDLGLVGGAIAVAANEARAAPTTCRAVLAEFRASFPKIVKVARDPTAACAPGTDPEAGSGGYDAATNHIGLNTLLSAPARAAHVTDMIVYWHRALAHEYGHAWQTAHPDFDWKRYSVIRGLTETDLGVLHEDYAETFAVSLGWMMRHCYGAPPYCFRVSGGHPTAHQIKSLRDFGLLPQPR